jgi:RimJ/RimL family protein N-acetyltransferase
MIKIKEFGDNQQFMNYNKSVIDENYFVFYATMMSMLAPSVQIMRLYNLYDKQGGNAYCLWYSGAYAIHSFQWDEELLEALSDEIDFSEHSRYAFTGQRDLIVKLLEENEVPYQIIKDRLIYQCKKIMSVDTKSQSLQKASIEDIEELSKMAYQYNLDEYGKDAHRTPEFMAEIIARGVREGIMYTIVVGGEIVSMAQVMSHDFKSPIIGMLFTKAAHRNMGYGYAVLTQLTNLLIANGHKRVGLLADVENKGSIKVFEKAGYQVIYKHILVALPAISGGE